MDPQKEKQEKKEKQNNLIIAILIVLVIVIFFYMKSRCDFKVQMRKLWGDHVYLTREVIFAMVNKSPNLKDATDRLLKNQRDIGDLLFNPEVSNLLTLHITIGADIINKTIQKEDASAEIISWQKNADEVSAAMKINPVFMQQHLVETKQEIDGIIAGDNTMPLFDMIHDHAMLIADKLS